MKTHLAICPILLAGLVAGLTSCRTIGFAGARQQTVNIDVELRFEGDISPEVFAAATGAATKDKSKGVGSLVSITTGEMRYDGTRGDLGGTKAITSEGDANAASTRTIDLPNSGGAGTVDMAGTAKDTKETETPATETAEKDDTTVAPVTKPAEDATAK